MAQIVPAILAKDKAEFADQEAKVLKLPLVERIQVDFGDGVFTPNALLPISDIDSLSPAFAWEAHLMVTEPQDFLDYNICGFKTIILHYNAFAKKADLRKSLNDIKNLGVEPAICLNYETPVKVLEEFKDLTNRFQVMGIKQIGSQGMPFEEGTYERIAELRTLIPGAIIEFDGGLSFDNAKRLADAGADFLVAGSVLSHAPNISESYDRLLSLVINKQ